MNAKHSYYGILVTNSHHCPICGNAFRSTMCEYYLYSSKNEKAQTTFLKSLFCDKCFLPFVEKSTISQKNLDSHFGYRHMDISYEYELKKAKRFIDTPYWTPQLMHKVESFPCTKIVALKDCYDIDEMFLHIFDNKKFSIDIRKTNRLRNQLIEYILNIKYTIREQKNKISNSIIKLIQEYLPYKTCYTFEGDELSKLIKLLFNDNYSSLKSTYRFNSDITNLITNIIEYAYFSLNNATQNSYDKLISAKNEHNKLSENAIKQHYRKKYIANMIYQNSPIYVNVYSGKFPCLLKNHKIESRTGFIKRIPDFHPIPVNLTYCYDCNTYNINVGDYQKLKQKDRILLLDVNEEFSDCKNFRNNTYSVINGYFSGLNFESKFKKMGYCVGKKSELSSSARKKLIIALIESNYTSKTEFLDYLHWNIKCRKNNYNGDYTEAIAAWESDINFINNYEITNQSAEYRNLLFVSQKVSDKIWGKFGNNSNK